jgi:F-box and leucine-rich repeat protein 2/20
VLKYPKYKLFILFIHFNIIIIFIFKHWNTLALDGSNWQYVDLFNFQTDVSGNVVENLAKRCNEFLKSIRLENCRWIQDDSIKYKHIITFIK